MVITDISNGAFTTEKCELLLRVLQWAGHTHGDHKVVALVLMGGHYFSNGIALNAIEHRGNAAPSPEDADRWAGEETWANINAIDDVVEYLAGDTDTTRSTFLEGKESLCKRGVTTIAVLRGNAAAGGVALAAACDVVMAAENTVLNPAYRAMGLHGSEFHS
jgi:enoyl-CoA hydratase/carnithine racemase